MPLLGAIGDSGAEGFGQNTPRPITYTGTPAENNRAFGMVRCTGNANTTLTFPNMNLSTNGFMIMLYRVASITSGVSTLAPARYPNILSSLLGTGSQLDLGNTAGAVANSLVSFTNTTIVIGTFFSGTTVGTDFTYAYFLWEQSAVFGQCTYVGNQTTRTVTFSGSASANCRSAMNLVCDGTFGNAYWGVPSQSTALAWPWGSSASVSVSSRWGSQTTGGIALGNLSTSNTQNITGRTYYAFCWDSTSSAQFFGSNNQVGTVASTSAFSLPTAAGKAIRTSSSVSGVNATKAMFSQWQSSTATAAAWTESSQAEFIGGNVPLDTSYPYRVSALTPPINFGSNFGAGYAGALYCINDSNGTGSHTVFAWNGSISDFNINTSISRPFVAGMKSVLIASGVTSSLYNIGNTSNYPFYYTFVMVVSGAGTGAIAARMYSRAQGFVRGNDSAGTQGYYAWNATAGSTQLGVGYDGANFQLAGLVSTQSHLLLYSCEAPRLHTTLQYDGNGTARSIGSPFSELITYMWVRTITVTGTAWILYHNVLGPSKYIDISGNNAIVTDNTVWNNTAMTSTTFSVGTSTLVNTNGVPYEAIAWCSRAGYVNVGYYPGASASQNIIIGFQPSTVIITDGSGTDGTYLFSAAIGMTAGSNYRMRLSGAVNNATLGDVCLANSIGFTMASTTILNTAGRDYYFIAFV